VLAASKTPLNDTEAENLRSWAGINELHIEPPNFFHLMLRDLLSPWMIMIYVFLTLAIA
jgi:hypothetical protein